MRDELVSERSGLTVRSWIALAAALLSASDEALRARGLADAPGLAGAIGLAGLAGSGWLLLRSDPFAPFRPRPR